MVEPVSFVGASAASAGTILKVIQHGFQYREVPNDVQAFQHSIESFDGTLLTVKRLRRIKSHLMDERDKHEIDQNIKRGVEIFNDISTAIEACRKDLSNKGTVSLRNRLLWLMRDHQTFISRTHTLSICHQSLNCDITGMRQLQPPNSPPSYDHVAPSGTFRPPATRRPSSFFKHSKVGDYDQEQMDAWIHTPPSSQQFEFDEYETRDKPPWRRPPSRSTQSEMTEDDKQSVSPWKRSPALSQQSEVAKDDVSDRPPWRRLVSSSSQVESNKDNGQGVRSWRTSSSLSQRLEAIMNEAEDTTSWRPPSSSSKQPETVEDDVPDDASWRSPCVNPDYIVNEDTNELAVDDVFGNVRSITLRSTASSRRTRRSNMIT